MYIMHLPAENLMSTFAGPILNLFHIPFHAFHMFSGDKLKFSEALHPNHSESCHLKQFSTFGRFWHFRNVIAKSVESVWFHRITSISF